MNEGSTTNSAQQPASGQQNNPGPPKLREKKKREAEEEPERAPFYDSDEEPLPKADPKRHLLLTSKILGVAQPHKPRIGSEYQASIPEFRPKPANPAQTFYSALLGTGPAQPAAASDSSLAAELQPAVPQAVQLQAVQLAAVSQTALQPAVQAVQAIQAAGGSHLAQEQQQEQEQG